MKTSVYFIAFLLCSYFCHGQKIEKYFDYNGHECKPNEARFYSLTEKTDSGWLRNDYYVREGKLQMKGLYKDSSCYMRNGTFFYFHPNGIIESKGKYIDNKKEGLWIGFHETGYMSDSAVYSNDIPSGTALQWYNTGYISDSVHYNEDGSATKVSWFRNGNVSEAGRLNAMGKMQGKWQFFHTNGKLSANEIYDNGILQDKKYFAEDGAPMNDTTDRTRPAAYIGGVPGWLKYLDKKLYFPSQYKIVNGDRAVVIIHFTVDENGKVIDAGLTSSFHPAFDDIAINTVKRSLPWTPAINHNRRVPYTHRQSISFVQHVQ